MFLQRSSRLLWRQLPRSTSKVVSSEPSRTRRRPLPGKQHNWYPSRGFHATRTLLVVKPVLLADIGEGIVECEIIQWFVEPGARVEEFSPLCEVQSDKASVEITSRFEGVVKKLYYDAGEMAKVGRPFVDIDIQGDARREDLDALTPSTPSRDQSMGESSDPSSKSIPLQNMPGPESGGRSPVPPPPPPPPPSVSWSRLATPPTPTEAGGAVTSFERTKGKCAALATPAVRHLTKELSVGISEINGTGKDGRVLKEDIYKFVQSRDAAKVSTASGKTQSPPTAASQQDGPPQQQQETVVPLSHTQQMMFKSMTRSLTIPHFLYADEVDFTSLVELRRRLNKVLVRDPSKDAVAKLSYLPFIIKAVSLALYEYPILNARVDVDGGNGSDGSNGNNGSDGRKPALIMRAQHNIGVAMDTPQGLLVPVVKSVQDRNVLSIVAELYRLQSLALAGRLSPQDMSGGTITVSNIGSIGGTYLSPVVVEREVAILGVGRMRAVPAFDEEDRVVKRHVTNFSWCADHRVVDGATLARAAGVVRKIVEEPDVMVMHLR